MYAPVAPDARSETQVGAWPIQRRLTFCEAAWPISGSVTVGDEQLRQHDDLVAQVRVVLLGDVGVVLAVADLEVHLVLAGDAAPRVERLEEHAVAVGEHRADDRRETRLRRDRTDGDRAAVEPGGRPRRAGLRVAATATAAAAARTATARREGQRECDDHGEHGEP